MNGDIWLGDLARALHVLDPVTPERGRAVAALLGLTAVADMDPAPARPEATVPYAAEPEIKTGTDRVPEIAAPPELGPSSLPPPVPDKDVPLLPPLDPVPFLPTLDPVPPTRVTVWPSRNLQSVESANLRATIPLQPLLAPASATAILRVAIAREVPSASIDADALVRAITSRLAVRALPRKLTTTLRFGVQALVDLGAGMEPFLSDRRVVLSQLQQLVGPENLSVKYFSYAPLRGVSAVPAGRVVGYRPPPPGSRVLLLSDLGLVGPPDDYRRSTRAEWESFCDIVKRFDCYAAALVPAPPRQWPIWLERLFPLISWDRYTTAGNAARWMSRR